MRDIERTKYEGESGSRMAKKWMKWGNELYYSGPGKGDVHYIIDAGDVEIFLDKNGEIAEIRIKNIEKYLEPKEIKEIADTYNSIPQPKRVEQSR